MKLIGSSLTFDFENSKQGLSQGHRTKNVPKVLLVFTRNLQKSLQNLLVTLDNY